MEYNQLLELEKALNLKTRYKAIFLFLLRSDVYVPSKSIAKELKVTPRTIKADIQQLRGALPKGFKIESYKSKGYKLKIDSNLLEEKTMQYYKTLQPATLSNAFQERVNYILRKLLVNDLVFIEQLLEELYITNISKELEEVKIIAKRYDIEFKNIGKKCVTLKGNNLNKSLLKLRLYNNFNEINSKFNLPIYESYFKIKESTFLIVEELFYKTLSSSEVVFSDLHAKRFLIAIILVKNSKEEDFSSKQLSRIFEETNIGSRERNFVEKLTDDLKSYSLEFNFGKNKIDFLVLLSIMSTDLYRFVDLNSDNYGELIEIAKEMVSFVNQIFYEIFNFHFKIDGTCYKDLNKLMIPITIKSKLKISDDLDIAYFNVEPNYKNKVIYKTVEKVSKQFYRKYNYLFSTRDMFMISNIVEGYFTRVDLPKTQFNIGIVAINGRLSTQQLKNNLQNNYGDSIGKITTLPLYQIEDNEDIYSNIDYFFCMEYGKNIPTNLKPIHFVRDNLNKNDVDSYLDFIFKKQMIYNQFLPPLEFKETPHQEDVFKKDNSNYIIDTSNLTIIFKSSDNLSLNFYKVKNTSNTSKLVLEINMPRDISDYHLKLIFNFVDSISSSTVNIDSLIFDGINYTDFFYV